jgi:hypothetical protein
MKITGTKIEVRFAEAAEFNVAPKDGWAGGTECVE